MHDQMIASGNGYTAAVHTHPIDLVAMTHNPAFLAKDVLTNLLWSMIPETRAFCPKGLGIVPYEMPSSTEEAGRGHHRAASGIRRGDVGEARRLRRGSRHHGGFRPDRRAFRNRRRSI